MAAGPGKRDLYLKRELGIGPEMQASAMERGCISHRAWYAAGGSALYAIAHWASREGANAFYDSW